MSNIGAHVSSDGTVTFCVWAPKCKEVSLITVSDDVAHPMKQEENGYFTLNLKNVTEYLYLLDNTKRRPDPASFWQPNGVHGASRVYDQSAFCWDDAKWSGIPLEDYICYELHVGCFTEKGTFDAIIEKLAYVKELGITAIELMPVIEFPGARNWGYDGTYPFAPHHAYGGPDALKKLINACHKAGLAVVLDVVYNHLGPEGNYVSDFGFYFTDQYKTPWGEAINFDGAYSDEVRKLFISNALYWLREFHVDALRLDAIHAMYDMSASHFLLQLQNAFQQEAKKLERKAYLIAESDLNDVRIINPVEKGGYALDAQWSDDFHHAVHALFTKSHESYFVDFGKLSHLAKALESCFVYDGCFSTYRKKCFGSKCTGLSSTKFVIGIQNHDQIANASHGKRLSTLIGSDAYRMASMLLFFAPNIPLLFMGQEWNALEPFLFFTSYEDKDLAESVRLGYAKEHKSDADPQNPDRFYASKLNWSKQDEECLSFYKRLIALRKKLGGKLLRVTYDEDKKWLIATRIEPTGEPKALLLVNFSTEKQALSVPAGTEWTFAFATGSIDSEFALEGHTACIYVASDRGDKMQP